jgi:hypothetical protein
LIKAQDLTATAVARLTTLDNSAYTDIAGSRASLNLLASIVSSSSLASTDIAHALLANPYEGKQDSGCPSPADDQAVRAARHAEAKPQMTGHLDDAAHQLDLSAIGCRYLAHGITDDLASAQDHQAASAQQTTAPAVTHPQYDALASLVGGGRLYESLQRGAGVTRVATSDGVRVSIATYRALARHGMVTADTSTSLYHGQKITVTELGRRALAQSLPHTALTAVAATPPKSAVRQGVSR